MLPFLTTNLSFVRASSHDEVELSPSDVLQLHEHLLDLGATLDLPSLRAEILQTCIVLMAADRGNLEVLDSATGTLAIAAQFGFDAAFLRAFVAVDAADEHHSLCNRAVVARQRTLSVDVLREPTVAAVRDAAVAAGFRSVQSTPVFASTGDLLAVVSTHWREPHCPTERQLASMDTYLRQAAHFLERRAADDTRDGVLAHERSARHAAEDASRGKDRLIATVAHELRQPLAPITAALELMKLRVSREGGERARHIVERQVAHMVRLIEDLLDAARIIEGKVRLRSDRVDLRTVVQDGIDIVAASASAKQQTLTLSAPDVAAWTHGDISRLQQVFANLLVNASKFSDAESAIRIMVGFEGADVRVDIQDQGCGISREVLPHIFEIFRQTTDSGNGGLGIGLSVVRGLVELHGGTVTAHSAGPGLGSTFVVRLPRAG